MCGNGLIEDIVLRVQTLSKVPNINNRATMVLVHCFLFLGVAFEEFRLRCCLRCGFCCG
jgi:hypothetical protein